MHIRPLQAQNRGRVRPQPTETLRHVRRELVDRSGLPVVRREMPNGGAHGHHASGADDAEEQPCAREPADVVELQQVDHHQRHDRGDHVLTVHDGEGRDERQRDALLAKEVEQHHVQQRLDMSA